MKSKGEENNIWVLLNNEIAEGKTVLVVDDGIATGFTMIAAVQELEKKKSREKSS